MVTEAEIIDLINKAEEGPLLDYKEDLPLQTDGDKAEFVKDVIALANSGEKAHLVIGVEDGTGRIVGFRTTHQVEQINEILKDKCDPPISVEYAEKSILGYKIGVVEIEGENPPYIVSVRDKFGGPRSGNPQKQFFIQRGTVFIRNYNINEGVKRADLDKIYNKIKYIALQADVELNHKVTSEPVDKLTEANIEFILANHGDAVATDIYVWMQFKNVKEITKCTEDWTDISYVNDGTPTVQLIVKGPVIRPIGMHAGGIVVRVDSDISAIEARVIIGATNMRIKDGSYAISLKKED